MTNREAAIKIIRRLRRNGCEALLAGGCVRDMLLRRRCKDYDVATDARPEVVMRLFRRTLRVGAKFGVVIVLMEDRQVEVATFRAESSYVDGRHPGKVRFTTAEEDAARRDFTINGMFYDPLRREILDYVGGRADLKKALIRTIGSPGQRFGEDYLRMLRAVRFSAQLGFRIEPATFAAICNNAPNITKISGERIAAELEGILVSPNRSKAASLLFTSGLAGAIFPGLAGSEARLGVKLLAALPRRVDFMLGLAGLFAGCSSEFAFGGCKLLKLSKSQYRHLKFLLNNRGKLLNEKMGLARLKITAAHPCFRDLYELQKAIQRANRRSTAPLAALKRRVKALGDIELQPKPLLNGHDLMRLGAVPGPALGQLAQEMYIAQLEGKIQNRRQAEHWAGKWLQGHSEK